MGTLGNPKTWVPYMNTKDCSQGFCSLYCPQWCYIIFPPPPSFEFPEDNSGPNFSPLVIAIIGILAAAFLLVSYYAIVSKYCGNISSARRRNRTSEDNDNPSNQEHFHGTTDGLDEAMIKSIRVCKYKKGEGLVESSDCSVCLGEFEEDESLRLLPNCSHAFHVTCIDVWLKSHSNCPLCRANVGFVNAFPIQLCSPAADSSVNIRQNDSIIDTRSSIEGDTIIEIRDDDVANDNDQRIRRSVSMDCSQQSHASISDMLRVDQDGDVQTEMRKYCDRSRVLHNVMSPVTMKRSFSGGRLSFPRRGRGRHLEIPI